MYLNMYRKNESIKRSSLIYAPTKCQSDFPSPSVLGINRYLPKICVYTKKYYHIHTYIFITIYGALIMCQAKY